MPITLNGDTGITTPGLINTGSTTLVNLTTTGNTILGDQSTDTLNVANGNLVLNSSGNLGIGTASPTVRLHVSGSSNFTAGIESSNTFAILGFKAVGSTGTMADPTVGIGGTGDALYMRAGGAERVRIDSSGNLLLATTTAPSSPGMALGAIGTVRALQGGMSNTNWRIRERVNVDYVALTTNITDAGTLDNAAKSSWQMGMGYGNVIDNWAVYRAPVGSSSFTSLMTLDSSGNLGVGTTSPASRLDVNAKITLRNGGDSRLGYIQNSGGALIIGSETSGTTELVFQTNGPTERARISASGSLGVSNTNPSYLVDIGSNTDSAYLRAQGGFLARKYTVSNNGTTGRTFRVTSVTNGLQFTNIFMDASAHYFNNGGSWQAQRYAFQIMVEQTALRHNIRMPNYEYGGATSGVFTVGNPPSWVNSSGNTWYFDFTVAGGFVSYITLSAAGPGIQDLTLTVIS